MRSCIAVTLILAASLPLLISLMASPARASHESTNAILFEPVAGSPVAGGTGRGDIAYKGGVEPQSRWTISFTFRGLQSETSYAVVDQGRFGEDGAPEATAFTTLCSFHSDSDGDGGCWDYIFALRRVNVLQLRIDDERGAQVLQASRAAEGPGAITSIPNVFSPAPVATPQTLPKASPVAS